MLIDRSKEWEQRNKYYREFMLSKLADVMEHVNLAKKMSSEVIVRKELDRAMEEIKLTRKGLEGKQ